MQANRMRSRRKDSSTPTVTETARRAQIVEAAITTIAEDGYPQASFARIAKRAGLSSTGLISYHFAGKQDLTTAIAGTIIADLSAFMTTWMRDRATSPHAALVAYIEGLTGYMQTQGSRMRVLSSIFLHGGFAWSDEDQQRAQGGIADILRWGQETGDFRPFDIEVMATTIQRSLDGIPFLQLAQPDLDLSQYAAELVAIFTRATAADS
ncbi:MAG TPA: TetR/AcrR family transcriptional regulator [Thermomicrobiales bacterium]|nr:TetR/AcrR family transcriptional regulator [Thermomicrobiales bacterium]